MLQKNLPEQLDANDPWSRDKLERKAVAEYLTPVLASIRQPFVLSLHSPYGTGKSFFLECWKADLEQQGFKVVLFNAWETDFSHDALSAFVSAVKDQTSGNNKKKHDKWKSLAGKTGGFIRHQLGPLLLRSTARKMLGKEGLEAVEELSDLDEDDVDALLGAAAKEALAAQEASVSSMSEFKKELRKLVHQVSREKPKVTERLWHTEEDRQKLIVFVDELDRCRPSYAIEVLESIKHFFAVEGLVFVLAVDDQQLKEAIGTVYGLNDHGEGYLRKFVDWKFNLPAPSKSDFCVYLQQKMLPLPGANQILARNIGEVADGVALIADAFVMSLREIEQAFAYANLILRSSLQNPRMLSLGLGMAAALFVKDGSLLQEICKDLIKADEFAEKITMGLRDEALKRQYLRAFKERAVLWLFLTELEVERIQGLDEEGLTDREMQEIQLLDGQTANTFGQISFDLHLYSESAMEVCLKHLTGASSYIR